MGDDRCFMMRSLKARPNTLDQKLSPMLEITSIRGRCAEHEVWLAQRNGMRACEFGGMIVMRGKQCSVACRCAPFRSPLSSVRHVLAILAGNR
jgi:hypothetical protein